MNPLQTIAALLLTSAAAGAAGPRGFVERTLSVAGVEHRYRVYVPPKWTAQRTWPVILFLHGMGERGDDGARQTTIGLGKALRDSPKRWPAIVVTPQCHVTSWWHDDPAMETLALSALDAALNEFHGDPNRVYLTGLSMGGYGAWAIASRHPDRFAALAVVCGGLRVPDRARESVPDVGDAGTVAAALRGTPVWLFHGARDGAVPPAESRRMAAALKAAGANVRYTEYATLEHNSWDKAYSEKALVKWLFAQSRRP